MTCSYAETPYISLGSDGDKGRLGNTLERVIVEITIILNFAKLDRGMLDDNSK